MFVELLLSIMYTPKDFPSFSVTSTEEVWITTYIDKGTMADGSYTRDGSVACPRDWRLGTKIIIDGKFYTCRDRYAKWVQQRQGNTIDIWKDISRDEAIKEGKKRVKIIKIN